MTLRKHTLELDWVHTGVGSAESDVVLASADHITTNSASFHLQCIHLNVL